MEKELFLLAEKLFRINRSITGDGVRESLRILKEINDDMNIHEVPSGTKVFDWIIPDEWNVKEAYIENEKKEKIIDIKDNNLHVVGYSHPIDIVVDKTDIEKYIHTQPDQPNVIPYVTSYYSPKSGFCMSYEMFRNLPEGKYHLYIDSEIKKGSMTYGEIVIPGESEEEICFSTNICHPQMGNNEISGPCVLTYLAKWIKEEKRRYTYRFLFIPETIGSISYIYHNFDHMKKHIIAGFVVTCVGDDNEYSYVESRKGNNLSDRVMKCLISKVENGKRYPYSKRGSDERQYCSPGVNLPFSVFCRSKFHEYPEYHTSADDLTFISGEGMNNSKQFLQDAVMLLENNRNYCTTLKCEPQLGKRGLYPTVSQKNTYVNVKIYQDIVAYADGEIDLIDLCNILNSDINSVINAIKKLLECGLIE